MNKFVLAILFSLLFTPNLFAENFDHTHKLWDQLLKKHVPAGLVNYKAFQKEESNFNAYLESLSKVSESEYSSFSQAEKIAFLINAYNSFTIRLILDHYPVKSITDIGSPFSKLNLVRGAPWKKEFFTLIGKPRTLDWIEHEKLRKDFSEPRIHFAIVCASIGCPTLSADAFSATILEKQLQVAKLAFLKNPSKNSYDKDRNILMLSPIFNWFKDDFIKKGTLIEFIQDGFSDKIKADALIEYNEYSWKLNEQK
jgi:L-rhamnose mutarotase